MFYIKPRSGIEKKPLSERALKLADELAETIGKDKVRTDLPTRLVYRFAHGPEALLHEDLDDFLPALTVHPRAAEDVEETIRLANEYLVPVVPQGGRSGSFGSEAVRDGMALDTTSMTKMIDFDEATHTITAEAGIRIVDFLDYIDRRGYMSPEFPTMNRISALGSRVALHGYNKFLDAWGSSGFFVRGIEVVLPYNAKAVWLGEGGRVPHKSQVGLNLMPLFFGSKGTLGVVTKVTEFFFDKPEAYKYGIMGFKTIEDGIKAYMELRKRARQGIWRSKTYNKWFIGQALSAIMGQKWPEDVEQITDFHMLGDKEVVEALEKKAYEICRKCGGFWRPDMPEPTFIGRMHETMEKYMGMAAVHSDRVSTGGLGNRIVPFDPAIPDELMVPFFKDFFSVLRKVEDGEHYPALATCMRVLECGSPVPGYYGWSKIWGLLVANMKKFDDEARSEYRKWFKEFGDVIWRHRGTLSMTHGFIPRDMRSDMIIREVGKETYELMKMVKKFLDPNEIMNPWILP